jgi:hypothetical protein
MVISYALAQTDSIISSIFVCTVCFPVVNWSILACKATVLLVQRAHMFVMFKTLAHRQFLLAQYVSPGCLDCTPSSSTQ